MKLLKSLFCLTLFLFVMSVEGQELPYKQIPEAPETFTAGTAVSRMLDGLGFRFYWATEGLTVKNLAYNPSPNARTTEETIDHILGLTQVILNSAEGKENGQKAPLMSYAKKRRTILENIQKASEIFKNAEDLSQFKIVFNRGGQKTEFPFWNQINGPISDALWHVGQVVSFRRSSGNPLPAGVNVLVGKRTEKN